MVLIILIIFLQLLTMLPLLAYRKPRATFVMSGCFINTNGCQYIKNVNFVFCHQCGQCSGLVDSAVAPTPAQNEHDDEFRVLKFPESVDDSEGPRFFKWKKTDAEHSSTYIEEGSEDRKMVDSSKEMTQLLKEVKIKEDVESRTKVMVDQPTSPNRTLSEMPLARKRSRGKGVIVLSGEKAQKEPDTELSQSEEHAPNLPMADNSNLVDQSKTYDKSVSFWGLSFSSLAHNGPPNLLEADFGELNKYNAVNLCRGLQRKRKKKLQ